MLARYLVPGRSGVGGVGRSVPVWYLAGGGACSVAVSSDTVDPKGRSVADPEAAMAAATNEFGVGCERACGHVCYTSASSSTRATVSKCGELCDATEDSRGYAWPC